MSLTYVNLDNSTLIAWQWTTNGVHFECPKAVYLLWTICFFKWNILDFYGAIDPSERRQMMEFFSHSSSSSAARVALAHAAHKILNGRCNSFMTFLWALNWKRKHKLVLSILTFFFSVSFFDWVRLRCNLLKVIWIILIFVWVRVSDGLVERIYCLLYENIQNRFYVQYCFSVDRVGCFFALVLIEMHKIRSFVRLLMGS